MLRDSGDIEYFLTILDSNLSEPQEITICGGASIVLNHRFREATEDIDTFRLNSRLKSAISLVSDKLGYPADFINDNVVVTGSFSEKLYTYKKLYKKYNNLTVYTLPALPLTCMKLCSFRASSNDERDVRCLIPILIEAGITIDDVKMTFMDIYGDMSKMSIDASMVLNECFDSGIDDLLIDEESIASWEYLIETKSVTLNTVPRIVLEHIDKTLEQLNVSYEDANKVISFPEMMFSTYKKKKVSEFVKVRLNGMSKLNALAERRI